LPKKRAKPAEGNFVEKEADAASNMATVDQVEEPSYFGYKRSKRQKKEHKEEVTASSKV
jgi:hypothetical protein